MWCVCAEGVGAELAEEMSKRIMVLDGAMGTMLQRRRLEEEDFRGSVVCGFQCSVATDHNY